TVLKASSPGRNLPGGPKPIWPRPRRHTMTEAKLTWSIWQALLHAFAWPFPRRGFHRFAEWITAMALNVEEHTITQSVLALEQPTAWKALESFAEYGAWHADKVTRALTRLIETAPGRIWS